MPSVSAKVSEQLHDRLVAYAEAHGITVSKAVATLLSEQLKADKPTGKWGGKRPGAGRKADTDK